MDQRVAIDWTSCQAHGLCAELPPLPARTVKRARRAAADCPVLALKVAMG
ncbi:ferredoxin [Streptomyces sp. NBC_00019]